MCSYVRVPRRAVRRWLRASGGPERHPPSAAEVERVLEVARGRVVACQLAGGRQVRRSRGRLHLTPAEDYHGADPHLGPE